MLLLNGKFSVAHTSTVHKSDVKLVSTIWKWSNNKKTNFSKWIFVWDVSAAIQIYLEMNTGWNAHKNK